MGIKQDINRIVFSGDRIDSEKLYRDVDSYEYVSFDLFDTLVKRNVSEPTDIFSIIERKIGKEFKEKRIEAEKKARLESNNNEIQIDDIYAYFPSEDRDTLLSLEIDIELDAIVRNNEILDVYNRCISNGKTVLITSDTYWPEFAIKKLLSRNGIGGYKALYLSSSTQKIKRDGSLFNALIINERIDPQKVVHIGDSLKNDYIPAHRIGIKAILIPRYLRNTKFRGIGNNKTIELNYLNHFINNTIPNYKDPYYEFGYSQFGKLLFGYVHWIHDEAKKRGINKLYFFARDGYIIKLAYEACISDKSIETYYIEVSRRSLRCPILWMDSSNDAIIKKLTNAKLVSLESIFDGIGLEIGKYNNEIKKFGLTRESVFDRKHIEKDERLIGLITQIKQDIISNSKSEYELIMKYLGEKMMSGHFGVVDIGYAGSMQCYLQQALTYRGIEHDISGFYLGVTDSYKKNTYSGVRLDLNGYLFDYYHNKYSVDTRSSFVGLFETLFLEQGGSVKRYTEKDGQVIPERYPYEYELDGKPTEDLSIIRRIQGGALDFLTRASTDRLLELLKCAPEEYFYGLYRIGTAPRRSDIIMFGDISFYDEGITRKLANPACIIHYIVNPRQMKNDFLQCRWKAGFLKRLFKIPLPYQKIYYALKRIG